MWAPKILLITALCIQSTAAFCDDLTLVVGFSPGGTSSVAARFIGESLETIIGSRVVVENRPGASGALAAEWVRRQTNSGILLFMSSTSLLNVPMETGLVPIALIATFKYVAAVGKQVPGTLSDYFDMARRDDSLRNVATAGAGSIPHLIGMKLFRDRGVPMVHIPYTGSAQAILSVISGQVAMAIVPNPDVLGYRDATNIVAETGKGIGATGWIGIFAPPGTSLAEVHRLSEIFRLSSEKSKKKLEDAGFDQVWKSDTDLQQIHQDDYALWLPELERLGIKP
jgi:tripartite-type tricarboxylate transporter receptor subunit TctC